MTRIGIMLGLLAISTAALAEAPAPQAGAKERLAIPVMAGRSGSASSVECAAQYGPPVAVSAIAFSPDGQMLAVGGYQEVLVWDLAAAKLLKRIGAGQLAGPVRALAWLDEGRSLAVGQGVADPSGGVKVFDLASGQVSAALKEPAEAVYALAVSPDGQFLAAGGTDAKVYVWTVKDKKLAATIKEHTDWVVGLAFSADSKQLATAGADKTLKTWEVGTWTRTNNFREAEALHGVAFAPDGLSMAVTVGGPGEWAIRIRKKDDPKSTRAIYTGEGMPQGIVWTAKTGRLYVACSDKTVKAFPASSSSSTLAATLRGHADWVYTVALSPDGARLASGSADGTVRLWSAADGKPLATLVQLAPRTDQWLILTPPGYLTTSAAGAIQWRVKGLTAVPEGVTALLDNAESVKKILAGQDVAPPALK